MREASDPELVTRVRTRRDELAFRALYRRHTPRLYRLQLRFTGGRVTEAEDLVQETWLRAVRRLETFRADGSFGAWLRGVAVNVSREWLRRTAADAARHDDLDLDRTPAATVALVDPDLERAVTRLPAGQRAILVLHDIEGFTHREIAAQLGIAPGTSKSQLSAARQALRHLLERTLADGEQKP